MSKHILTADGQLYHVDVSESELYHYGVPGMKWGQRKQRVPMGGGMRRRGGSQSSGSSSSAGSKAAAREQKKARVKKGLKIGAAVAGTALAAYGAYKLSKAAKTKARSIGQAQIEKAISSAGITGGQANALRNKQWDADNRLSTIGAIKKIYRNPSYR